MGAGRDTAPLRLSVMTSSQEGPLHSRSPVYTGVVRGQSRSRTRHPRCGRLPPSVRGGNLSWILSVATPEVRPLDATQQRSAEVADELGGQVDVFRRHVLEASECRQVVPVADHEYSERHHPKALRGLDGWGGRRGRRDKGAARLLQLVIGQSGQPTVFF